MSEFLLEQHQLLLLQKITRFQRIDIKTRGGGLAVLICAIPNYRISSALLPCIDQRDDVLTDSVVNSQCDVRRLLNLISKRR